MIFWKSDPDRGVHCFIRVSPGAAVNKLGGVAEGPYNRCYLNVRITVVPEKGKANKAAIRLLATALGVSASECTLLSGEKSRYKTVEVRVDVEKLQPVLMRLAGEQG